MLSVFYEQIQPRHIMAIEQPFSKLIPDTDFAMVGIYDLVETDDEGTLMVCELKTSSKRWSENQLKYDLQGSIYSWAISEINDDEQHNTLIRYDVIIKNIKPLLESYYVRQCLTLMKLWRQRQANAKRGWISLIRVYGHIIR